MSLLLQQTKERLANSNSNTSEKEDIRNYGTSSSNNAPKKYEEDIPGLLGEFGVGLLFAAHKNPAIAASQTILILLQHPEYL